MRGSYEFQIEVTLRFWIVDPLVPSAAERRPSGFICLDLRGKFSPRRATNLRERNANHREWRHSGDERYVKQLQA